MKKQKIFLLIGLTKESEHWDDDFVANLKKRFNTDEVVAFDLPGAGKHLEFDTPSSISGIVKKMRELHIEDIQTDSETENILVAISLGGMIGTEWNRLFPDDFQKFVIINSSFKNLSPVYRRVQPKSMKEFLKIFKTKDAEKKEQYILDMCANNTTVHDKTRKKWVEIAHKRPVTSKNILRQTFAASKYKVQHKPEIPVYIIAARHDKLAHYTCSQQIHKKWGGDFTLLEEEHIGHGVHLDAPEKLARLIHNWCTSQQVA